VPYPFDRSELNILLQAPLHAVIAVVLVEEIDPVEFLQRLRSGARILVQSQQQQSNFGSLAAMLSAQSGSSPNTPPISLDEMVFARECELLELLQQFGSATEGQQQAIACCAQASILLAKKVSYSQAQAYCNWLLSVARSVAEALQQESNTVEMPLQYPAEPVLKALQAALTIPPSNL
jgi:hypothetical protein